MKNRIIILLAFINVIPHAIGQTVEYSSITFTEPLFEESLDTLIVDNCIFNDITGTALVFKNIHYVEITDCDFNNISLGAIGGSGTDDIHILRNTFDNIHHNAITLPNSSLRNGNIEVSNNIISNIFEIGIGTNRGIKIYHADTVKINNNTISYVGSGIVLGSIDYWDPGVEYAERILYAEIDDNNISYTHTDGISSQENIETSFVRNNTISYIAYDGEGERPLNGDHGIYWQAPDALIQGNEVFNNFDSAVDAHRGVGISIRTSVRLIGNKVYNCAGAGVNYYNDHTAGEGPLLVANNIIYDNGDNGIYVSGSAGESRPDSVLIYNNTIVNEKLNPLWHHSCPIVIKDMPGFSSISGNLLIYQDHTDSLQNYWIADGTSLDEFYYNVLETDDIGFIDFVGRNLDISSDALLAIDQIPSSESFVNIDFYGNSRDAFHDVGAHEIVLLSLPTTDAEFDLNLYPNPTNERLNISGTNLDNLKAITIINELGQVVMNMEIPLNQKRIEVDLLGLNSGIYFLSIVNQRGEVISYKFIKK